MNGFAFSQGRSNPHFLSQFPMCATGAISPSTVCSGFVWGAGPGVLADTLAFSRHVAYSKCASLCLDVPVPIAPCIAFNSLLPKEQRKKALATSVVPCHLPAFDCS